MSNKQWRMDSEIGELFLVASERGLRGIFWEEQPVAFAESLSGGSAEVEILRAAVRQLEEYFAGERTSFELPLDVSGTEFQRAVWEELARIPYGATISYRELARRVGREKAVRAVGAANGRNPICLVVPCHRVIAADGGLGGYSVGLEIKARLLELERRGAGIGSGAGTHLLVGSEIR